MNDKIEGLRYALSIIASKRGILNRTPGYLAALDEIETSLLAAIDRLEHGEQIGSVAIAH